MVLGTTFSHLRVSSTLLEREVIFTNYSLTVIASGCTSTFSERLIDAWNSLSAKSNDFSSLARFSRFVKSTVTHLSRFLLLGY